MSLSRATGEAESPSGARKLLVFDMAFTLEMIRERGLEHSVTCRDLDGFFSHVWTVHPFATLLTSEGWSSRYGRPVEHRVNGSHTFIEGRVGRYSWLSWIFPLNFLIAQAGLFLALSRLIRKEGISVIRAGEAHYLGLFALGLARLCGVPLVVRIGANYDKIYETTGVPMEPRLMRSRKVEKVVERFVLRRADLVAGANQDNLDFALANGARPQFSTLFRYGNLIDKRHFVEPSERAVDARRFEELGVQRKAFLLCVGRLEAAKRPDDVVRVLAEVRRRGFDVKAVLAGEGRLRPALETLARELGVEDHVVYAGNRSQPWLSEMIPSAAVILSPHTGRALSEAALGTAPIVAYDIDWQGELIETGVTGVLTPFGAWREMADGVERLLSSPGQAEALGRAARLRALEMLDPDALDQHERDEYLKLLARHSRRRAS